MAYVSKVNVEGTVYDVKDELAVHEDSFNNAFIAALGDVVVKNSLLSMFYPIGKLWVSETEVDPTILVGGVWERVKDVFFLAAGDIYAGGTAGGSADAIVPVHNHAVVGETQEGGVHGHTATGASESAGDHTHGMNNIWSAGAGSSSAYKQASSRKLTQISTGSAGAHTHSITVSIANALAHKHSLSLTSANTGEAGTNKNLPPYKTVFVWRRIA